MLLPLPWTCGEVGPSPRRVTRGPDSVQAAVPGELPPPPPSRHVTRPGGAHEAGKGRLSLSPLGPGSETGGTSSRLCWDSTAITGSRPGGRPFVRGFPDGPVNHVQADPVYCRVPEGLTDLLQVTGVVHAELGVQRALPQIQSLGCPPPGAQVSIGGPSWLQTSVQGGFACFQFCSFVLGVALRCLVVAALLDVWWSQRCSWLQFKSVEDSLRGSPPSSSVRASVLVSASLLLDLGVVVAEAGTFAERLLSPEDANTQFHVVLRQADASAPAQKELSRCCCSHEATSSETRVLTDWV
ncbi:hypothetical protein E5288_WYG006782 [Bos mutus]|uniref:Uncharacterized protein n=1 Tax=Bos mutus TaxID=72004 RepID=A0A6B0RII0_9CETA|nr:hypothetical protein [Bos mutus]